MVEMLWVGGLDVCRGREDEETVGHFTGNGEQKANFELDKCRVMTSRFQTTRGGSRTASMWTQSTYRRSIGKNKLILVDIAVVTKGQCCIEAFQAADIQRSLV